MRYFYLINIIFLLLSCHQETELPDVYEVTFHNRYFEPITSVEIADNIIEAVNVGENITFSNIPFGQRQITVITQSGLIIEAVISLIGSNPYVNIVLTENGQMQIK